MSMGWMSRLGVTTVVAGTVAFGLSGVAAITTPDGGVGGSMILALVFMPAVYVLLNRENGVSQPEPVVTRDLAPARGAV